MVRSEGILKTTVLFLMVSIFLTFPVLAQDELSPMLKESLNTGAHEPSILGAVFSLVLVICLIYATGILYQRLIKLNPKWLNFNLKNAEQTVGENEFEIVSSKSLGQGKYLHVVEINNISMVLGSTPSGITLLKELPEKDSKNPGEEKL